MITMYVDTTAAGRATAWTLHAGRLWEASSNGEATQELARIMAAEGTPEEAWELRHEYGGVRMHGPSLHRWAKLTVTEGQRGMRMQKWRAFQPNVACETCGLREFMFGMCCLACL